MIVLPRQSCYISWENGGPAKIPGGLSINLGALADLGRVIVAGIGSPSGSALHEVAEIQGQCAYQIKRLPALILWAVVPTSFRKRVAASAPWLRLALRFKLKPFSRPLEYWHVIV